MSGHGAETCTRLGCHDGRFLSRHHVCECNLTKEKAMNTQDTAAIANAVGKDAPDA